MAQRIPLQVRVDDKSFCFETGATFRGLTISEGADGYRIIVRAFLRNQQAVYAMVEHESIREGVDILLQILCSRAGNQLWRHDGYYYKRNGGET